MPRPAFALYLSVAAIALFAGRAGAQAAADPMLVAEIAKIRAIDEHAHPLRVVLPGEKPDDEYDALAADAVEPFEPPDRLRPDNPIYLQAWRALYAYPYNDASPAHIKWVIDQKKQLVAKKVDTYAAWVLDQAGIDTMFANRVATGHGLAPPRFRWVPFEDALLFPLNNAVYHKKNKEMDTWYTLEEKLFRRYLSDCGMETPPSTLDDYISKVVTATLERQKKRGAIAVKFEAAYLRGLDFGEASVQDAAKVYAQYAAGDEVPPAEYKTLQDYLMRYIAKEAGRLGLPVHFHTGTGVGGYFDVAGSNPALLEPLVDSPDMKATTFVLLHGGAPFQSQTAFMLQKVNVYTDFSAQTYLYSPRLLSQTLREWLTLYPAKVMFATDAFTVSPEVNWEEMAWVTSHTARQAIALALTGMMQDGEITRARAVELAHMVLHDNAKRLYNLPN